MIIRTVLYRGLLKFQAASDIVYLDLLYFVKWLIQANSNINRVNLIVVISLKKKLYKYLHSVND